MNCIIMLPPPIPPSFILEKWVLSVPAPTLYHPMNVESWEIARLSIGILSILTNMAEGIIIPIDEGGKPIDVNVSLQHRTSVVSTEFL